MIRRYRNQSKEKVGHFTNMAKNAAVKIGDVIAIEAIYEANTKIEGTLDYSTSFGINRNI